MNKRCIVKDKSEEKVKDIQSCPEIRLAMVEEESSVGRRPGSGDEALDASDSLDIGENRHDRIDHELKKLQAPTVQPTQTLRSIRGVPALTHP